MNFVNIKCDCICVNLKNSEGMKLCQGCIIHSGHQILTVGNLPRSTQFTFISKTNWGSSLSQNLLQITKGQLSLRKTILHNGNYIYDTVSLYIYIDTLSYCEVELGCFLVLFHKEAEIVGEKIQWLRLRECFSFCLGSSFPK